MLTSLLRAVAILGCALLLVGCSDTSSPTGPEDPTDDPTDPGDGGSTVQFDSEAPPGDSARSFLDDRRFAVVRLEVDYMEGYEPTAEALDSLRTTLDTYLSKSSIQISDPIQISAEGEGPYSTDQVQALEDEHRDHYTRAESDTIHAHFLILDGKYADENVVGIAYYNTSMAFFGKTIDEITGGLNQPSREKVEATVFRHEFGHNLGLVNNGIPPQQESHHDEENGAHCTNEQCVMYYAIETTDFFSNVFDGTIPTFEQFCTEDMAAQDGE
jgi:predicted Zn-dependent protease